MDSTSAAGYTRPGADGPPYDGKTQVWRVSREGGEPFPVTRIKGGVGPVQSSAPTAARSTSPRTTRSSRTNGRTCKREFSDLTYGHGVDTFNQVWMLDLESWREKKIVDEKRVISELAVAHDGERCCHDHAAGRGAV